MGSIASRITSLVIVYSTVYSDADQSKHQSSASLAFVWGIHRRPVTVNSPHKWPVTRKMFPFDDVITVRDLLGSGWIYRVVTFITPFVKKTAFQRRRLCPFVCPSTCPFLTPLKFLYIFRQTADSIDLKRDSWTPCPDIEPPFLTLGWSSSFRTFAGKQLALSSNQGLIT